MLLDRAARACEILLELGWLTTLLAVPIYFNVDDVRAFEPDKAILLRDSAALLGVLALLRLTLRSLLPSSLLMGSSPGQLPSAVSTSTQHQSVLPASPSRLRSATALAPPWKWGGSQRLTSLLPLSIWRSPFSRSQSTVPPTTAGVRCHPTAVGGPVPTVGGLVPAVEGSTTATPRRFPTLLPMLALAAVTLLATATSMLPVASWNGSYARGQGALTTLAYLTIGLLVLGLVRRPTQARRLGVAIALSGAAPAGYGWVQHFGRDPLPWQQADLALRVPGTMGNPIFLGALLVLTLPLALNELALALRAAAGPWSLLWLGAALLEAGALYDTKSRGPFAGLLVALAVWGLALARAWDLRWLRRLTLSVAALALGALLGANLLGSGALGRIHEGSAVRLVQWTPYASGSSEVRLEIWGPALRLVPRRPLLGCGPDALLWCYYAVYPTTLRHIEAPNAVPDRTHNLFLDALVETGLLGLAALLALLGVTAWTLFRLTVSAADPTRRALAAALLAALLGHVAEGSVGIPIIATDLLTWLIAGLAGALWAMEATASALTPARAFQQLPHNQQSRPSVPSLRTRSDPAARNAYQARGTPAALQTAVGVRFPANAVAGPGSRRPMLPSPLLRALRPLGLCVALVVACRLAWQVLALGATATAADVAARQGANLEAAALGNSGQAPVPAAVHPDPILALRQFAAAAADQQRAIALAPGEEEYLLDAGTSLVEWAAAAGSVGGPAAAQAPALYVQALLDFGQAARLNPYNPDHLRNTGKAYERWAGLGHDSALPLTWNQQLLDRAAQAFARAAQLAPRHPDPLTSWAQVALWQGHPSQALALANRALGLDGADGDAYAQRGLAELALGQRQAALADWRLALVDPNLGHPGEIAAQLALAEATWGHARCAAVRDARTALGELDTPNPTTMKEIIVVDGPHCPGS